MRYVLPAVADDRSTAEDPWPSQRRRDRASYAALTALWRSIWQLLVLQFELNFIDFLFGEVCAP
jgi:hypothetical protein